MKTNSGKTWPAAVRTNDPNPSHYPYWEECWAFGEYGADVLSVPETSVIFCDSHEELEETLRDRNPAPHPSLSFVGQVSPSYATKELSQPLRSTVPTQLVGVRSVAASSSTDADELVAVGKAVAGKPLLFLGAAGLGEEARKKIQQHFVWEEQSRSARNGLSLQALNYFNAFHYLVVYDPKSAEKELEKVEKEKEKARRREDERRVQQKVSIRMYNVLGCAWRVLSLVRLRLSMPFDLNPRTLAEACRGLVASTLLFELAYGKRSYRRVEEFQALLQKWRVEPRNRKHFLRHCQTDFVEWMDREAKARKKPAWPKESFSAVRGGGLYAGLSKPVKLEVPQNAKSDGRGEGRSSKAGRRK